jgi:myo-inositol-1(or 4)-monophosphatase
VTVDGRYTFLQRLAHGAGRLARDFWVDRDALTVELKGPQDFVTVADREVETFIRAEIAREYPDDAFLGEETSASFSGGAERLWIVDPIDGTHNFLRGIPYWNVSIAWVENGVRTLGAVYDPAHDELFHARRGRGAFRTDTGGETRLEAATTTALSGALVAVGHSDRFLDLRVVTLRRALMETRAAFRNFGSAALQLAHVAAGRLDAYVELELSAWDAMAGLLLVEEAGGRVAPFPGPRGLTVRAPVVAAAPGIADELTTLVNGVTREER